MSEVIEEARRGVGSAGRKSSPATMAPPRSARRDGDGWQRARSEAPSEERLARALGWLSIGLGLAELTAPRRVAGLIGIGDDGDNRALLCMLGLREIASGVGILTQRRSADWLWARVGGDAMDLALLGAALSSGDARRGRVAAAAAAVVGVTMLDLLCAQQLSRGAGAPAARNRVVRVERSIGVNRSPEECYRFWRDLANLPRFMKHLESVQATGERRSYWVTKAPAGMTVEWESEIVDDRPNERIAWRSLEGADVDNAGEVRFEPAPAGRGTVVSVRLEYRPPGGRLGPLVAKLFGREPAQQAREDLRRFKQVMEVGEIITTEGQPAGRRSPGYALLREGRGS